MFFLSIRLETVRILAFLELKFLSSFSFSSVIASGMPEYIISIGFYNSGIIFFIFSFSQKDLGRMQTAFL